jgi:ribonuclease P protein component
MMPDIRRLKTRRDFLRVAAARRKRVRPGLIVQAARQPAPPAGPASPPPGHEPNGAPVRDAPGAIRVGFTASRKVGNAVDRNRARRRLRAVAADVLPALGEAGTDYVLVARKATLERPYGELVRDLHEALIQLGYQGHENHRAPRHRRRISSGPRASSPGDRK